MPPRMDYLDEMGIEVYVRRGARPPAAGASAARSAAPEAAPGAAAGPANQSAAERGAEPRREASATAASPVETDASSAPPKADAGPEAETWRLLEREVSVCTACGLHETRTQTVFGVGDHDADWMFIGEGPGFEEDRQGEPFVGRAGKLLDKMIAALGFDRRQVYIANAVKCRPPENRNPRPEEIVACNGYLQRQVALVAPKVIVALGAVAANTLLECEMPVGKLRGRVYRFGEAGIPLVVTYHPAYLLRAPLQKRAAWQDLQLAQRAAAGEETP